MPDAAIFIAGIILLFAAKAVEAASAVLSLEVMASLEGTMASERLQLTVSQDTPLPALDVGRFRAGSTGGALGFALIQAKDLPLRTRRTVAVIRLLRQIDSCLIALILFLVVGMVLRSVGHFKLSA